MISFAIIGCGHIARKHAEAIQQTKGAKLYAVCDLKEERMQEFIDKYDTKSFLVYEEMLQDKEIDVICICTPSGLHAPLTIQAAKYKKHVLVEKPMALTLEDAKQMIIACQENNVKLSVVHPNRFRPAMQRLKHALTIDGFGKISHANATVRWNRNQAYYDTDPWRGTKAFDGGVLMNQAIHNLDLLLWLVGDVEEVSSLGATRFRQIETEDVAVGVLRFATGALGVVEAATTIYPKNLEETLSVFGEKGSVVVGGTTATKYTHWNVEGIENEELPAEVNSGHQCIIEDLCDAIITDREPIVSGEDGKRALALVLAFYESMETGQIVKVKS